MRSMNFIYKSIKDKLENIFGVSLNENARIVPDSYKSPFACIRDNLNFFDACMTRVITSLKAIHESIIKLEELYQITASGSYYKSELEAFQVMINSELLKITDIYKSTKYKGISLLDMSSENFLGQEKLFIDIYSHEKYEINFPIFNADIDSDLESVAGINLGACNKLGDLCFEEMKNLVNGKYSNDFVSCRFNIERMIDKALSISATLNSKSMLLSIIEHVSLDEIKIRTEIEKIDFTNLENHASEDALKIAQYV
jgi:phosphotransferase system IIB component